MAREGKGYPCYQYDMMMMMMIYLYVCPMSFLCQYHNTLFSTKTVMFSPHFTSQLVTWHFPLSKYPHISTSNTTLLQVLTLWTWYLLIYEILYYIFFCLYLMDPSPFRKTFTHVLGPLTHVWPPLVWNPSPLQSSKISFEYFNQPINIMGRVFSRDPADLGSIPGWVIP